MNLRFHIIISAIINFLKIILNGNIVDFSHENDILFMFHDICFENVNYDLITIDALMLMHKYGYDIEKYYFYFFCNKMELKDLDTMYALKDNIKFSKTIEINSKIDPNKIRIN